MPVPVVEYKSPPVDASLLANCETVPADFATNGELLAAFVEANKRLAQCDAEKAEIRRLLR